MPDVLYSHVEDELKHYGVKGMRWGVRKAAGRLARKATGKTAEEDYSDDAKRARDAKTKGKSKGVASLSNKELRDLNERLNLEQQYAKLTSPKKSDGQKMVENILKEVGSNAAKAYLNGQVKDLLKKATG